MRTPPVRLNAPHSEQGAQRRSPQGPNSAGAVGIKLKINKAHTDWEKAFLNHSSIRQKLEIEHLFHGKLASKERIVVGLQAQYQVMLSLVMEQDGTTIEATGHILSSAEINVVTE